MKNSYGLPDVVKFCRKCTMPNTRPGSSNEYRHTKDKKHEYIKFDEDGICSACRFNEAKWNGTIDWKRREEELIELLNRTRRQDGGYDILVPGSGGKDSIYASHVLKYKYKMNPLTVTWAPHLYTDIGWKNFQNWQHVGGFDNYLFTPNGKMHRLLTRNAFLNLCHSFQPFILGQKTFAIKMAARFDIPLIFYGEPPGEYGARSDIHDKKFIFKSGGSSADRGGFRMDFVDPNMRPDEIFLGGKSLAEYLAEGVSMTDLAPYLPLDPLTVEKKNINFHFLGYYLKWIPQECYYYSVDHAGFQANSDRTEGTYSKYNSIDDRLDGFFYYTTYIKFGYGRATQDTAQEIRNHHITRDEGVALIKKYDGEFPKKYFKDFLEYCGITEEQFHEVCDRFRSPHLWEKKNGQWKLKYTID